MRRGGGGGGGEEEIARSAHTRIHIHTHTCPYSAVAPTRSCATRKTPDDDDDNL